MKLMAYAVLITCKPFLFFLNNLKIATMLPLLEKIPPFDSIFFADNPVAVRVNICFPAYRAKAGK
jgi:hypothetical protein